MKPKQLKNKVICCFFFSAQVKIIHTQYSDPINHQMQALSLITGIYTSILPEMVSIIQQMVVYQKSVYELSSGEKYAVVGPQSHFTTNLRGIDKKDLLRKEQHIKCIDCWQYIRKKLKM